MTPQLENITIASGPLGRGFTIGGARALSLAIASSVVRHFETEVIECVESRKKRHRRGTYIQ